MQFLSFIFRVLSLAFIAVNINVVGIFILNHSGPSLIEISIHTFLAVASVITLFSLVNKYVYSSMLTNLNAPSFITKISSIYLWSLCSAVVALCSIALGYLVNDGHISFTDTSFFYSLAAAFIGALFPGIVEEISYRWFLYGSLRKHTNKLTAATLTGVVFALLHFNQTVTIESKIILLVCGVFVTYLFCAIYEKTGSIWPGAVFHTVWDVVYSKNFIFIQTGNQNSESNGNHFTTIIFNKGNILTTGGDFGLESSVLSLSLYIIVTLIIIWRIQVRVANSDNKCKARS